MSQLEMISEAPVACSVIKALRHKNANISFISEVCKSAGLEGSKKQATLSLGTVQTERTFHSRLRRDLPVVSTKEVSLKIGQRICKRRVSFVLLSSYLAWLWKRPKVRNLILYGQTTSEERCAFIAQLNKAPHMQGRQLGLNDIVFKIHGDEGPYFKKRNLLVVNASTPWSHSGDTFLTRLPICVIPGHQLITRKLQKKHCCQTTLDEIMEIIVQDLDTLRLHANHPAKFYALGGDLKWFQQVFHYHRHWSGNGWQNGNRRRYWNSARYWSALARICLRYTLGYICGCV
ncbi:unnamed protein product [Effrenium voratum]|uniref:Uncharacterized protein n=1 Tax=Effrenium voratum TaxID=2562239 RepID=A0AA36HRN9_9DINO|nr:unnamed protein product [Effrenium voratum]